MVVKYEFDGTIIDSIKNDRQACEFAHDNRYKIVKKFVWHVNENYDSEFEPDETEKGKIRFHLQGSGFASRLHRGHPAGLRQRHGT